MKEIEVKQFTWHWNLEILGGDGWVKFDGFSFTDLRPASAFAFQDKQLGSKTCLLFISFTHWEHRKYKSTSVQRELMEN